MTFGSAGTVVSLVGTTVRMTIFCNRVEHFFGPVHRADSSLSKIIVNPCNIRSVKLGGVFSFAKLTQTERIAFVMTDVNGFRIKNVNHFVQYFKQQAVAFRIGWAINIREWIVGAFSKLLMRVEQVIGVLRLGTSGMTSIPRSLQ